PTVDYSALAERYAVTVLRGAEVETDVGHVLVYGVNQRFTDAFDLADVALPHREVFRAAKEFGGFAVGAHAGRPRIGLAAHVADRGVSLDGIEAHFVSAIGRCLTAFNRPITSIEALVEELRAGDYQPVRVEETRDAKV